MNEACVCAMPLPADPFRLYMACIAVDIGREKCSYVILPSKLSYNLFLRGKKTSIFNSSGFFLRVCRQNKTNRKIKWKIYLGVSYSHILSNEINRSTSVLEEKWSSILVDGLKRKYHLEVDMACNVLVSAIRNNGKEKPPAEDLREKEEEKNPRASSEESLNYNGFLRQRNT